MRKRRGLTPHIDKIMASTPANTTNIGFEQQIWAAADILRGNMDAAEYKHVVLGLIFLKYISDKFAECSFSLLILWQVTRATSAISPFMGRMPTRLPARWP